MMKYRFRTKEDKIYFIYEKNKDDWFGYYTTSSYKEVFSKREWQSLFTEKEFEILCKKFGIRKDRYEKILVSYEKDKREENKQND